MTKRQINDMAREMRAVKFGGAPGVVATLARVGLAIHAGIIPPLDGAGATGLDEDDYISVMAAAWKSGNHRRT